METQTRSVVKTVVFKIITTSITAMWIGSLGKAIALHLVLTAVYLLHERGWNKIHWGRTLKP